MASAETSLVFLHLPKAAGSTLRGVIVRQYDPAATHTIRVPIWPNIDEFRKWPQERRHGVRLLLGHMPFGLHEYLRPPATYVTMVREPVGRIASHFDFIRTRPGHELYDRVRPGMSLAEYVREETSLELDNGQVRLLSGDPFVPFGAVTREHLDTALRNLDRHFSVAGVSERFDDALLVMRRVLGWNRRILYVSRNVTRTARTRPSDDDVAGILAANRWDAELHAYAAERFEAQARRLFGRSLSSRLARFRAANHAYGGLARVAAPARAALSSR